MTHSQDPPKRHPILDHPLIGGRYFFPRPGAPPDPVFVEVTGARLACWRSAPPSERPVLVHFHGNGELVADWVDFFSPLCQSLGYDVFLAEYRGYGGSTGSPELYQMLQDVDAIYQAVAVPETRVVVFGRSVGSIFALEWIKRYPETAGLVIESGIHDVYQRLRLRVRPEELGCQEADLHKAIGEHLDHGAKLRAYQRPSLLLHAQGDQLVTVEHAVANAEAAQHPTLTILERGGHNDILAANVQRYVMTLSAYLSAARSSR